MFWYFNDYVFAFHIHRNYIMADKSDPLQENRPFAKIFQNAVGAPKVMLAKKLILNLNNFWSRNGSPLFSLHFEQI